MRGMLLSNKYKRKCFTIHNLHAIKKEVLKTNNSSHNKKESSQIDVEKSLKILRYNSLMIIADIQIWYQNYANQIRISNLFSNRLINFINFLSRLVLKFFIYKDKVPCTFI